MIKLEELINSVKTLIEVEKNKGIADHGEFHSLHEAYAVALEEYQEADEELKRAAFALDVAWKEARSNNKDFSLEAMRQAEAYAMLAAAVLEPSGGHPEWHILGDALPLINGCCKFKTMDGCR